MSTYNCAAIEFSPSGVTRAASWYMVSRQVQKLSL